MGNVQINLRAVTEADLPNFVVWLNDPEVTQFTVIESGNITLEGEREWLARISSPENPEQSWAIEAEGRIIGASGLRLDNGQPTASFGIIIGDKSAWDKGYGRAVVREVLRRGFEEFDLHRIYLTVFARNHRASRCYEKCGFHREGLERQARLKRDKWEDIIRMAILREEWQAQGRSSQAGDWSI
jgi:[ribosomal protein S5]-alanine N-acetyltransferase